MLKKILPLLALSLSVCAHPVGEGRSYVTPAFFGQTDAQLGPRMQTRLELLLRKHCEESYVNENGFGCFNHRLSYPDRTILVGGRDEFKWSDVGKVIIGSMSLHTEKWVYIRSTEELRGWQQYSRPLFEAETPAEAQEIADLMISLRDFYRK